MESKFFLSSSPIRKNFMLSNRGWSNCLFLQSFWVWTRCGSGFLLNRKDVVLWYKSITTKMQFSYKFLAGKSVFHEEKKLFLSDVSIRNHLANWSSFYFSIRSSNLKKYYYRLLWFEAFFSNLVYHNPFLIHHEKFEY